MEKVSLFINKLQELANEKAHPKVMMAVAQMLVTELEMMETAPISSRISVIMPKRLAPEVDFVKYKEVAATPVISNQFVDSIPAKLEQKLEQPTILKEELVLNETIETDLAVEESLSTFTPIPTPTPEIELSTVLPDVVENTIEKAPEKSIHDILRETIENSRKPVVTSNIEPINDTEPTSDIEIVELNNENNYVETTEDAIGTVIPFSEEDMIAAPNEPSFPAFAQTYISTNTSEIEPEIIEVLPEETITENTNEVHSTDIPEPIIEVVEQPIDNQNEQSNNNYASTSSSSINETIAPPAKTIHEILMETIAEAKRTIHDSHVENIVENQNNSYTNPVFEEAIFTEPVIENDANESFNNEIVTDDVPSLAIQTPIPIPEQELIAKNEHNYNLTDIEIPTLSQIDAINYPQEQVNETPTNEYEEAHTINTTFKENKQEVSHILENTHIKDLRKAIGINDKYLFINELFNGDENLYEKSIKHIQHFSIYAEATFWIQKELKTKLHWNPNTHAVELFDQLVKRRFS